MRGKSRRPAFLAAAAGALLVLTAPACESDGGGANDVVAGGADADTRDGADVPAAGDVVAEDASGDGAAVDAGGDAPEGKDGGGGAACVTEEVLAVLEQHIADLNEAASRLAGHGSDREAVGFLLVPGLDPGILATFAGPLVAACDGAFFYDATCDGTFCGQIECTGRGAGWAHYHWLDATPVDQANGWRFEEARVVTTWEEGAEEVSFTLESSATDPGGADWTLTGSGVMGPDSIEFSEDLPALLAAGAATLTVAAAPDRHSGALTVGGVEVATLTEDGALAATLPCP